MLLKKHFWLLSMLKTVVLHNIFVEIVIHFIFQDSQMNRKFKRTAFIWNFINLMHPWWIKPFIPFIFLLFFNIFNIDNNHKCFLSSKSAYYYDFCRSCDTEDWSNYAENTDLITEINYSLTDIHIENSNLHYKNISQFFQYIWSNKCSLCEQKRLFQKHLKIMFPNFFPSNNSKEKSSNSEWSEHSCCCRWVWAHLSGCGVVCWTGRRLCCSSAESDPSMRRPGPPHCSCCWPEDPPDPRSFWPETAEENQSLNLHTQTQFISSSSSSASSSAIKTTILHSTDLSSSVQISSYSQKSCEFNICEFTAMNFICYYIIYMTHSIYNTS